MSDQLFLLQAEISREEFAATYSAVPHGDDARFPPNSAPKSLGFCNDLVPYRADDGTILPTSGEPDDCR